MKQRVPIEQITILNPNRELFIFAGYAIVYVLIIFLCSVLIKSQPIPWFESPNGIVNDFTFDLWYMVCGKGIFLFGVPMLIYHSLGYNVLDLCKKYKFVDTKRNIMISILFFILGSLLNQSSFGLILKEFDTVTLGIVGSAFLSALLAAAIPEEIFYRLILQTRIEKKYGMIWGILGSSIACTLFHFPSRYILANGVEGVAGNVISVFWGTMFPVFIVSLIFAFLWAAFRNIYMLIFFHLGIDFIPFLSILLGISL